MSDNAIQPVYVYYTVQPDDTIEKLLELSDMSLPEFNYKNPSLQFERTLEGVDTVVIRNPIGTCIRAEKGMDQYIRVDLSTGTRHLVGVPCHERYPQYHAVLERYTSLVRMR